MPTRRDKRRNPFGFSDEIEAGFEKKRLMEKVEDAKRSITVDEHSAKHAVEQAYRDFHLDELRKSKDRLKRAEAALAKFLKANPNV